MAMRRRPAPTGSAGRRADTSDASEDNDSSDRSSSPSSSDSASESDGTWDGDTENASGAAAEPLAAAVRTEKESVSFASLGLNARLCSTCASLGLRQPTAAQRGCVPQVLRGRNVLCAAETGSGKTAAFALPILQSLSRDPYGIFAMVLTPTRELAVQIVEQFHALGTRVVGGAGGVRVALVIGGDNMMRQAAELQKRPHVIVGTPGRVRFLMEEGAQEVPLRKMKFLVLDEADRLLVPESGFADDIDYIASHVPPPDRRQTLLFSATMASVDDASLDRLGVDSSAAFRLDLTTAQNMPASLRHEYVFMPSQVKNCYLMAVLRNMVLVQDPEEIRQAQAGRKKSLRRHRGRGRGGFDVDEEDNEDDDDYGDERNAQDEEYTMAYTGEPRARSVIIFIGSCQRCQEISEMLTELQVPNVALHSVLTQSRRLASLGKFKSQLVRVLVCTDVASRGLDIPEVDLVVNFDVPRDPTDYVHRVGRTARAGRPGRALSLVSQFDVPRLHEIEEHTSVHLDMCAEVKEEDALPFLNPVAKAMRVAHMQLLERGFDDQVDQHKARKREQNRRAPSSSGTSASAPKSSARQQKRSKKEKQKKAQKKTTGQNEGKRKRAPPRTSTSTSAVTAAKAPPSKKKRVKTHATG